MLVVKNGSWFLFLRSWLPLVPKLEPGNKKEKKKIPACMFMGTGTPALIFY